LREKRNTTLSLVGRGGQPPFVRSPINTGARHLKLGVKANRRASQQQVAVAINFLAFQIGWFACVLGAANGLPWLGVLIVSIVLALAAFMASDWKQELSLAIAAAAMGFAVDSALIAFGIFAPVPYLSPAPLSPLWMVMLWANQATTLNSCLAWLRGRFLLGASFGSVGGPLAYFGGAKLGAAALPSLESLMILGAVWAVAFPALLAVADLTCPATRRARPLLPTPRALRPSPAPPGAPQS
jgi:hypothetical protein